MRRGKNILTWLLPAVVLSAGAGLAWGIEPVVPRSDTMRHESYYSHRGLGFSGSPRALFYRGRVDQGRYTASAYYIPEMGDVPSSGLPTGFRSGTRNSEMYGYGNYNLRDSYRVVEMPKLVGGQTAAEGQFLSPQSRAVNFGYTGVPRWSGSVRWEPRHPGPITWTAKNSNIRVTKPQSYAATAINRGYDTYFREEYVVPPMQCYRTILTHLGHHPDETNNINSYEDIIIAKNKKLKTEYDRWYQYEKRLPSQGTSVYSQGNRAAIIGGQYMR